MNHSKTTFNTIIGWVLGISAVGFVLLLGGLASGALTDDPPTVSPYATGSNDAATGGAGGSSDVFETDAYDAGASETGGGSQPAAVPLEPAAITIASFAFGDPITLTIGQSVVVTNTDGVGHTWTARDGTFDSGLIDGGDGFEFVFDQAGTYEFFCTIHPTMTGTITVEG